MVFLKAATPAAAGAGVARLLRRAAAMTLLVAAGYLVPLLVHSDFYLGLANDGLVLGMLALGAGFLMYQCNLVMFGIAALYGGPCYLFAIAGARWGWGPTAAAAFAIVAATLATAVIGLVVVRAKPLAFAMLTLAIGQMLHQAVLLTSLRPLTGGEDGLVLAFTTPFLGYSPEALSDASTFWTLAWTATCIVMVLALLVTRSYFGSVLRAIRDNEERMRFSGFNTFLPRLAAFTFTGFVCAVAGTVHMLGSGFASPELLDFLMAGNVLVAALFGGIAGVVGPVVGGVAFTLGLDQFATSGHLQLFTGAAVVLVIVALPAGVDGLVRRLLRGVRGARQ
jgi:branched-chain amino acid transport system permease protein